MNELWEQIEQVIVNNKIMSQTIFLDEIYH